MFNQRPTSLLGLEPRHDGGDLLNFLSPIITTPDEYIKYFDYFLSRERLNDPSLSASTPTTLGPNSTLNHFHHQQQQHIQQQQLQPQQQQQQLNHHQQQQLQPQHQHQHQLTTQTSDPIHYQQQQQPPLHLTTQQQQQPQHQHQQLSLPPTNNVPNLNQTFEVIKTVKRESAAVNSIQECNQPQTQAVQPSVAVQDPIHDQLTANNVAENRSKLTDEEKIRNKRERNRRAAANCRRRKDEKLRKLTEENMELRKTIENLQGVIASLRAGIVPIRND